MTPSLIDSARSKNIRLGLLEPLYYILIWGIGVEGKGRGKRKVERGKKRDSLGAQAVSLSGYGFSSDCSCTPWKGL
jgi:hypothetical protein